MLRDRGVFVLVTVGIGLAACGPSRERVEAGRVIVAVEAVRAAEGEARRAKIAALEAEHLESKQALEARDACVDAFGALLESQTIQAKVQAQVAAHTANQETAALLLEAQQALTKSAQQMPACDTAMRALRVETTR